jgi:hypothetical protein
MEFNVRIEDEEQGENHTHLTLSQAFDVIKGGAWDLATIRRSDEQDCEETEVEIFTRSELTDISKRAKLAARHLSQVRDSNPFWKYAYQTLAHAADHLDAIIAGSELIKQETLMKPEATNGKK